jgi:hypothetical protein
LHRIFNIKYEYEIDSTLYTYSALVFPQTPMYVGNGVIANRNTDSFPDVDKKSKNLLGVFNGFYSTFVVWLDPLLTAAKCSTTSSFF